MNETDIDNVFTQKTHPLFNDWKLKCEGKITSGDLAVRIALHIFSTINDYRWQSPPIQPAIENTFDDMTDQEKEDYISWFDEKERRWLKNKYNLALLIEQRKVLKENEFHSEAEAFVPYILEMREHGIKTFREHTCYLCRNDFHEEING